MGAENLPIIGPLFKGLSSKAASIVPTPAEPEFLTPVNMNASMNGMETTGTSSIRMDVRDDLEGDPWSVISTVAVGHPPTEAAVFAQGTAILPGGPTPNEQSPIYEQIVVKAQGPKAPDGARQSHHMMGSASISVGRMPGPKRKR